MGNCDRGQMARKDKGQYKDAQDSRPGDLPVTSKGSNSRASTCSGCITWIIIFHLTDSPRSMVLRKMISIGSNRSTRCYSLKQVSLGVIGVLTARNERLIEVKLLDIVFGDPVILYVHRLALLVAPAERVSPIGVEMVALCRDEQRELGTSREKELRKSKKSATIRAQRTVPGEPPCSC
jgi:hypothetical protein